MRDEVLSKLQTAFHDHALWAKAGKANGKIIPSLDTISDICRGIELLIKEIRS